MATLLEITNLYHELSFLDRIVFYTTLSNDVSVHEEDIHSFLVKTRMQGEKVCVHCGQSHIVKNGKRKDGTQRYLCRDCHKSFLPSSGSIVSRSRKPVSLWAVFLKCMLDRKTLEESSEECHISKTTAFLWRHKILLSRAMEQIFQTGHLCRFENFTLKPIRIESEQRKEMLP